MKRRAAAGAKPPARRSAKQPHAGRRRGSRRKAHRALGQSVIGIPDIDSVRRELERVARASSPPRWNANPDDVQRSVVKLVLTLIELIRQLLERQAIRRMDAGTLTADETEAIGLALMRLEETVRDLGTRFGLAPEDLNLDLGPIGKLL